MRASLWLALSAPLAACATGYTSAQGRQPQGVLQLRVEPAHARLYIDERYQGQVDGWAHQAVPVPAGLRRVQLAAPGYITQRFDLEIGPDEQVTLELTLEHELEELPDEDAPDPLPTARSRSPHGSSAAP